MAPGYLSVIAWFPGFIAVPGRIYLAKYLFFKDYITWSEFKWWESTESL